MSKRLGQVHKFFLNLMCCSPSRTDIGTQCHVQNIASIRLCDYDCFISII